MVGSVHCVCSLRNPLIVDTRTSRNCIQMLEESVENRIYTLEKEQVQSTQQLDSESQGLLADSATSADEKITKALDKELDRITAFYRQKEEELTTEFEQLCADEAEFQHELQASLNAAGSSGINRRPSRGSLKKSPVGRPLAASTGSLEQVDEGSSDEEPSGPSTRPGTSGMEDSQQWDLQRRNTESAVHGLGGGRPHRRSSIGFVEDDPYSDYTVSDSRITLKKRAISSYVSFCELKSYVQLNWTGFSKALKKYDKTCNRELRRHYLSERVEKQHPFQHDTREALNEKIVAVEELYARVCTDGDVIAAQKELKLHLREHVVWERNTVWREMIGIERRAQAAALGIRSALVGGKKTAQDVAEDETKEIQIRTPVGRVKLPRWCPSWLFSANMATLIVCLIIFTVLLLTPTFKSIEQANCLAMLVFVSLLWATEVLHPSVSTNFFRSFLSSSPPYSCQCSVSCFKSSEQTTNNTPASPPPPQQNTSSPQCGRLSSCSFSVVSPSPPLSQNTVSPNPWQPTSSPKQAQNHVTCSL